MNFARTARNAARRYPHVQILVTVVLALIAVRAARGAALPEGFGRIEVGSGTNALTVFTYKPHSYAGGPFVVVFHGLLRNAQEYCRHAVPIAERFNVLIAAPLFDTNRFSNDAYSRGGVFINGALQPREKWTFARVPEIVNAVRAAEHKPALPYYFLGHSAGGQFLMRFAGLYSTEAKRIVAANPGTDLFPRRDWDFGFGFGGLPATSSDDAALQRYLAAPLTLYLGQADTDPNHPELDRSTAAKREGAFRLERGRACFEFSRQLANRENWTFNWRKVEVPGIAHEAKAMFASKEIGDALFGPQNHPSGKSD